jgi:hypothetical protein
MTSTPESADENAPEAAETSESVDFNLPEAVTAEPGAESTDEADPAEPVADSQPPLDDDELVVAHDLALAALREVTPAHTIGEPAGYIVEDGGAVSLSFANTLPGYPGWFWTVSVARVAGEAPTVLEVELLPGAGALLAPEWVPWAVRLADYQAAQTAALAEVSDDDLDDLDDDEDEDDDDFDADDVDDDDDDADAPRRVHAGDVDGVDIDELDTDGSDELDEESDNDGTDDDATEDDATDDDSEDDADELDDDER